MNKIAFIIPGLGCPIKNKEYQEIAKYFKQKNFKPVIVEINWKRNTHTQYVEQFKKQYTEHVGKDDKVYILGFSFGAMISCISVPELKPDGQILCSPSPFFQEDMPKIKKWWKDYHGKRRCEVFNKLSFANIAKQIKCKTYIIAGNKEGIEVGHRAKDAKKKIKNSELFFLEGVRHDIADRKYLNKIAEIIKVL